MRLSPARILIVLSVAAIALLVADRLVLESSRSPLMLATSDGRTIDPFDHVSAATVFIFTRSDCPVSNRYAPEVRRLHQTFAPRNVSFWLVYPDPDVSESAVREHLAAYEYPCGGLRDPRHELVRRCAAQMTPEAAVFVRDGSMVYRGRIDDRQVALGVARATATVHDLEDVLAAVVEGRAIEPRTTQAVGCFIADLK